MDKIVRGCGVCMASNFNLILDTTPPFIKTTFVKSKGSNTILLACIESDDFLEEGQKIGFVDTNNSVHDHILELNEEKTKGHCAIELELYPKGIVTSSFRVKDEVWNLSNIVETQFDVSLFKGINSYIKALCITNSKMIIELDNAATFEVLYTTNKRMIVELDATTTLETLFDNKKSLHGELENKKSLKIMLHRR